LNLRESCLAKLRQPTQAQPKSFSEFRGKTQEKGEKNIILSYPFINHDELMKQWAIRVKLEHQAA
jgi:hypothetical protein